MNYLRLAIAIVFVAFAQCSHADSIQTFYATQVSMSMDSGGGVFFTITGPGLEITGDGGALCLGCPANGGEGGSPSSQIFIGFFFTVIFGGKSYDGPDGDLSFSTPLFDDALGVNPTANGVVGVMPFKLILPQNGNWQFDYVSDPYSPTGFDFNGGTFLATAQVTPEPGTIALVFTGLAGIAGIVQRKAKFLA